MARSDQRLFVFALISAVAVLVLGTGVYLGLVKPKVDEAKRLEADCDRFRTQILRQSVAGQEGDALLRFMEEGRERIGAPVDDHSDALTYLGQLVEKARVTSLELTSAPSRSRGSAQAARLVLKATGRYDRLIEFVRLLEGSLRPARVDGFSIELDEETTTLLATFTITIFDSEEGLQ